MGRRLLPYKVRFNSLETFFVSTFTFFQPAKNLEKLTPYAYLQVNALCRTFLSYEKATAIESI